MSNRGYLYTNPNGRVPTILAESKSFIPLFWLSLLSSKDIEDAVEDGLFVVDRKRALERSSNSLPFMTIMFPKVPQFEKAAASLLKALECKKSPKIGIDVKSVLPESDNPKFPMPDLDDAVAAIERKDPNFSFTVPEHPYHNPFTGEDKIRPATTFSSTAQLLLSVCSVASVDLKDGDKVVLYESIVGHIKQGNPSVYLRQAPKKRDQPASLEKEIAKVIRKHGWFAASITDQKPEYIFSIGLAQSMNHPEFTLFGLPVEVAHGVLTELVREIKNGKSFAEPGTCTIRLKKRKFPIGLRPVHRSRHLLYFVHALNYYNYVEQVNPLQLVQVFWNDDHGNFPFDAGCEPEVCKLQPRLDLPVSSQKAASIKNLRDLSSNA